MNKECNTAWYISDLIGYVIPLVSSHLNFTQSTSNSFRKYIEDHPEKFTVEVLNAGAVIFGQKWRNNNCNHVTELGSFKTSAGWYTDGVLKHVLEHASTQLGFTDTEQAKFRTYLIAHPDYFRTDSLDPGAIEFGKRWRSEHSE